MQGGTSSNTQGLVSSAKPLQSQQKPTDTADEDTLILALANNGQEAPETSSFDSSPSPHAIIFADCFITVLYLISTLCTKDTPHYNNIDNWKMALPRWIVPLALVLLMIDAIIELSFISSMVAWLHSTAGGEFEVIAPEMQETMSFSLHGKPKGLLVNQGHTSNGAAGTAFVLVGLGGILVLALRHRASNNSRSARLAASLYYAWLVSTMLSALLTLAALAYTFALTNETRGQSIDIATAASLDNRPYPNYVAYPTGDWTPETWFEAVLDLTLVERSQRSDITHHLTIMRAWRWNLIPLFILGLGLSAVAVVDAWKERKNNKVVRAEKFEPMRGQGETA